MKEPQLSGIAKALAAHGRKGDDMLVHVSRKELAALERMGEGLGIHLTKNPATGLPEAFNWLGALGGVVGGVIGTIIAPGAGTAAGAALGSGVGTAAGGGTAKQALMAGVIGGITGYVGGAGAGELATAGEQAIAQEALQEGTSQVVQQGIAEGVGEGVGSGLTSGTADLVSGGVQGGVTDLATNTAANTAASNVTADTLRGSAEYALQGADQFGNLSGQQYGDIVGKGLEKGLTTDQINANLTGANAPFMDKLKAGWDASASASSPFAGQGNTLLKTGVGLATLGSINPGESSIVMPTTATANPYTAEWYTDPATGQQRTRAVKRAAQGGTMFSDYDAADAASDGGYSPGGEVGYATGGIASVAAAKNPPNTVYRSGAFDVYAENLPTPMTAGNITRETPAVLPKGFFSKAEYAAASPEERAEMDRLMAAREELLPSPMRRRQEFAAANGGIADLGSYSDGGRLLKGPGDGVSDNIPATIEGKRPARLADGEFVVPARAVSELGNGSTEAGSKQLYKMLDRIASKRKKGKGLAYEANPEKLLPA